MLEGLKYVWGFEICLRVAGKWWADWTNVVGSTGANQQLPTKRVADSPCSDSFGSSSISSSAIYKRAEMYIVMMKMAGLNIFNLSYIIDIIYYIWMFVFLTFFDPGIRSRYAGLSQQWSLVIDIHFRWQFSHGLDSTNNPHRIKMNKK